MKALTKEAHHERLCELHARLQRLVHETEDRRWAIGKTLQEANDLKLHKELFGYPNMRVYVQEALGCSWAHARNCMRVWWHFKDCYTVALCDGIAFSLLEEATIIAAREGPEQALQVCRQGWDAVREKAKALRDGGHEPLEDQQWKSLVKATLPPDVHATQRELFATLKALFLRQGLSWDDGNPWALYEATFIMALQTARGDLAQYEKTEGGSPM